MPSRTDDVALTSNVQSAPADPAIQKIYDSPFDPVDFLNESLPNLSFPSGRTSNPKNSRLSQIQQASAEVQNLLSRLNAHNVRCSNTLTNLTDEILRSGSRLAYEVEILRGDVNSLFNVLTDSLQEDIQTLTAKPSTDEINGPSNEETGPLIGGDTDGSKGTVDDLDTQDPEFITQLRTLGLVKSRLEAVIHVFGEAMQWPLPPSEFSMTSSLISVSAPEHGMVNTSQDDKAREVARRLRSEVADLLELDGGGYAGLDAATKRVEELRDLASVWKGTAEEKARTRLVDGIAKMVEDRKKSLDTRPLPQRPRGDTSTLRSNSMPVRPSGGQARTDSGNPAAGLLRNLQRLKDEIYLE